MTSSVYFRGSREEAKNVVRAVVQAVTGNGPDIGDTAKGVFIALGFAALSDIKADYVRKARGEVGEDGVKWAPLKPETLAYSRRFGKGEAAALKRAAGLGRGHRFAPVGKGLLNAAELKRWKKYFAQALAWLVTKVPIEQAKGIAAGMAWNKIKAEGGKTKLMVFGNRPHEILRDTGVLLNSLSPGEIGGDGTIYTAPQPGEGGGQIFSLLANGVIVGTNVKYAATHQYGDPKRKIPARPFLPTNAPRAWLRRWNGVVATSIESGLKRALRGKNATR
jgi:hypothetical protein